MDQAKFKLFEDDYIDPLYNKLENISSMCNLNSTELRDIQNIISLAKDNLEELSLFIKEYTQLK